MKLTAVLVLCSVLCLVLCSVTATAVAADYEAVDDLGTTVTLSTAPEKIVSLAPHLTELLFSLGVGSRVAATVKYSDYPPAAKKIPRLGDAFSLSVEAVVDVSPDLILAWSTGGNQRTLTQLQQLGYPVYQNEALNLDEIARNVERVGRLVGESDKGLQLAEAFRAGLMQVKQDQMEKDPVRVFFQISDNQLYTVNGKHLIGQAISTCGGHNVFSELSLSVPMVSLESVLDADPEVILVASPREGFETKWSDQWQQLGWQGRIRYINASLITRPGLRMLEGIKILCKRLRE